MALRGASGETRTQDSAPGNALTLEKSRPAKRHSPSPSAAISGQHGIQEIACSIRPKAVGGCWALDLLLLGNASRSTDVVSRKWLSGSSMDDADQQAPERYRDAAERLRDLAEQTPLPDIQADLMSLAAYFDRMAAHLEAQRRPAEHSERGNI
jgi:hypothetical protein